MNEPTILTELHPYTYELCSLYYNGMGDPLYAVLCIFTDPRKRSWATDLNLPWSTGHGDGFYAELTRAQIHALRRAGERFPATIKDEDRSSPGECEMNEMEEAEEAAFFYAGDNRHDDGEWPADLNVGDDDEPDEPAPSLFNHPRHGLMLMGDEARRRMMNPKYA